MENQLQNLIISDIVLLVYMAETIACYLAFFLFLGWAIYKYKTCGKYPTSVYVLVMLLFLFQGYAGSISVVARWLRSAGINSDVSKYVLFMNGYWWHTRVIPRLIIETLILWRMGRRVYINFFKEQYSKRLNDNDGSDV